MTSSAWLKAVLLWLGIVVLAVLNGFLREAVLIPHWGRFAGLVASGVALALLILLVAWLAEPWWGTTAPATRWQVGAAWLVLTLLFETGLGRLVLHKPWPELLAAYTFDDGNLWPAVLAITFAAPWLACRARHARKQ